MLHGDAKQQQMYPYLFLVKGPYMTTTSYSSQQYTKPPYENRLANPRTQQTVACRFDVYWYYRLCREAFLLTLLLSSSSFVVVAVDVAAIAEAVSIAAAALLLLLLSYVDDWLRKSVADVAIAAADLDPELVVAQHQQYPVALALKVVWSMPRA